jgi:hypothetical protein
MSEKSAVGAGKDVVYIDVDDEITTIIDKVRSSHQKITALVLPKRATVFQSVVNMKLLKRAADAANKNVVLITSEAALLPLAGRVGVHVARSLQSKPEVPDAPLQADDKAESIEENLDYEPIHDSSPKAKKEKAEEAALDKTRTVGELAGGAAVDDQLEDTIDLADDEEPEAGLPDVAAGAKKSKRGKDKKLKVPNFNKFRVLIVVGALVLVALIVGAVVALKVLPKAAIVIKTNSSALNSSTVVALKTGSNVSVDLATSTVPATSQQTQKTATQQVAASGQQNNGAKATGSVSMTAGACSGTQPADVPAGVGLTVSGLTFITQQGTSFTPVLNKGKCTFQATSATSVIAQNGGAQYNVSPSTFTVSGRPDVSASSSAAMTGGTDSIIKIVTQADIDSAKQKITAADTSSIKQELKSALIAKGLYVVDTSFNAGTPAITTSSNPGDQADTVTVTTTTTYTMLGVSQNDLQSVVKDSIKSKIDLSKQKILDYGLSAAVFGLQSQNPDGATVTMQATVVVGSELNTDTIKKQVAGKKAGDAQAIIKQYPGVTDVTVQYSPFWVSSIPNNTGKITVTVQKPTSSSSSSSNASNP